jgi:hypothetical protein
MKDDDSLEPVEAPASSNIVTLTASMEKTAVIEVRRDTEVTDVVPATEEPKVDTLKPKSSVTSSTRDHAKSLNIFIDLKPYQIPTN